MEKILSVYSLIGRIKMESSVRVTKKFTLVLTEQEAHWLNRQAQIPEYDFPGDSPESIFDREMRTKFYEATAGARVGLGEAKSEE